VIDVSHHLPDAELSVAGLDGGGRQTSCAPAVAAERRQTNTGSAAPGEAAVVALVRLLARQAAKEHISEAK
jgi:hypothetical protein